MAKSLAIYNVKFEQDISQVSKFGFKYRFYLQDAIDDCPEYIAHHQVFKEIAAEYGLECELYEGFHPYFEYHSKTRSGYDLLTRIGLYGRDEMIKMDDWEVAGAYSAFRFKRI
jgi:mRNA (guanine-N7-)-methyltransferase